MRDADLLDLLEILGDVTEAIEASSDKPEVFVATHLAQRKIDSFRSAIRQRMNHQQENV